MASPGSGCWRERHAHSNVPSVSAPKKGWDEFSLHLSTGEKVMVFRLRDGTSGEFRAGTWIGAAGAQQTLDRDDIALAPLSETHVAGRVLPLGWRLQVKSQGIDVETAPVNAASWMRLASPIGKAPSAFAARPSVRPEGPTPR